MLQTTPVESQQDLLSWLLNLPDIKDLPARLFLGGGGTNFPQFFSGPSPFARIGRPPPPPRPLLDFRPQAHQPMTRPFRVVRPQPLQSPPIFHATDVQRQRMFANSDAMRNFFDVQRFASTTFPPPPRPVPPLVKNLTVDSTSQFRPLTNSVLSDIKMSQFITSTPDPLDELNLKVFHSVKPEILDNAIFRSDKLKIKPEKQA